MQSKHKFFWLVLLIFIVVGWYLSCPYPPQSKLSSVQETHMKELLTGMKTHCIGRYLIDLPASFNSSTGTEPLEKNRWIADIKWPDNSYNTYIASKRMYYPAFEQLLKRREKVLSETQTVNPVNMPFLKKVWPLPEGLKGVIFERNLDASTDDAIRTLEAYVYSEGVAFKLQKESINDLDSRYKKDRERRGSETNYIPGDLERLNDLLSRIKGRRGDDIPREVGSCIANGFIAADKKGDEQKDIAYVFSSEKLVGINIVVSTNNFIQEKESLLDRSGELSSMLSQINGKMIRKGRREINNINTEEMLVMGPKPGREYPIYVFDLYANETHGSNQTPWLNVNLSNQSNPDVPFTGYSQEEIEVFWTTITQSLRMRPGAY